MIENFINIIGYIDHDHILSKRDKEDNDFLCQFLRDENDSEEKLIANKFIKEVKKYLGY